MDASLGNVERGGGVLFPPPILGGSVFVGEVEAQNEGAWRFTSWDGWLCTALLTPLCVCGGGVRGGVHPALKLTCSIV